MTEPTDWKTVSATYAKKSPEELASIEHQIEKTNIILRLLLRKHVLDPSYVRKAIEENKRLLGLIHALQSEVSK